MRKRTKDTFGSPKPNWDLLIRYVGGELSPKQQQAVQNRIQSEEEWKAEAQNVRHFLSQIRSLPESEPPESIWDGINQTIVNQKPKTVWFPWFYAHPAFANGLKTASACVLIFFSAVYFWSATMHAPYQVIMVKEGNGFAAEAETYMAYHDLYTEPTISQENLIALYTYEPTK